MITLWTFALAAGLLPLAGILAAPRQGGERTQMSSSKTGGRYGKAQRVVVLEQRCIIDHTEGSTRYVLHLLTCIELGHAKRHYARVVLRVDTDMAEACSVCCATADDAIAAGLKLAETPAEVRDLYSSLDS